MDHLVYFGNYSLYCRSIYPGFFLACLGIAALVSGIVDLIGGNTILQFILFCLTTIVVMAALRPLLVRFFGTHRPIIKTNYEALVGKTAVVEETIDVRENKGRIKIGGDSWRAVPQPGNLIIPVGAMVTVLAIDGNKLIVGLLKEG